MKTSVVAPLLEQQQRRSLMAVLRMDRARRLRRHGAAAVDDVGLACFIPIVVDCFPPLKAFSGDHNKASPASIIRLYNALTHGAGLYFGYQVRAARQSNHPVACTMLPARRRAFVFICREVIPLTEESVHLLMCHPRGSSGLWVKYYVDH